MPAPNITAVFATVYASWVMTTPHRLTTPTRAALIYTLEPVFAAIFSVWLAGDRLTVLAWSGGGLIVAGMLVAELWPAPRSVTPADALVESSFEGD
jgi:drug/metabolite transporter (DMT)-like permease